VAVQDRRMALLRAWIISVMAPAAEAETKFHMGTMDYIARRYYSKRDAVHGKDADKHLLHYMKEEDGDKANRLTAWLGESPNMQLGSYVLEECGFTRGTFAYFCTFDFNGYVLKYDSIGVASSAFAQAQSAAAGLRLMESLALGRYGGHFLAAAAHGGEYGFFATAGGPASIITVNLDKTPLEVVSHVKLPADYGGIYAMSVDSGSTANEQILLAILGAPPVRIALFNVSSAGVLTEKQVHEVANDDEAACPSSAFVDRETKTALIATVAGCVHRVSYAGGILSPPAGWDKVCSNSAARFRRMAVAKRGQVAVVGSFYPVRQLLLLDLSSGKFTDAMPLPNRDIMFVTNIMSTNNDDVYVVGNSMKGMPALMQMDLRNTNKLNDGNNWGIIAAGVCDEYSWTEDKKKRYSSGEEASTSIRYWPIRYYGCTWIPKGRVASGAVLSPDGRLYIAARRNRCTVCTEEEKEFTAKGGFCVEEFEDYRSPASECGQHEHNKRPFVRERMLSVAELQRESNTLAGGENFTLIEFQLGKIPEAGEMHAPVIKSHAARSWSSLGMMLGIVLCTLGNANPLHQASGRLAVRRLDLVTALAFLTMVAYIPAAAGTQAKAFHQLEHGCQCLLGCTILGEDSDECTDNNRENAIIWERRLAAVPNDDRSTCDLMKCIAYCAGPEASGSTQMMGRQDEMLCASIAKQIDCQMDCSGAHRVVSCFTNGLLPVMLMFAMLSWAV